MANTWCKNILVCISILTLPSVLWRCWLGGRKGIRPVKTEWWDAGVVICLERGADLHIAQLMTLPLTISCFSKIQIGFTFLVPAHPGSPGKRAVKRMCVCVCVFLPLFLQQNPSGAAPPVAYRVELCIYRYICELSMQTIVGSGSGLCVFCVIFMTASFLVLELVSASNVLIPLVLERLVSEKLITAQCTFWSGTINTAFSLSLTETIVCLYNVFSNAWVIAFSALMLWLGAGRSSGL